MHIQGLLSLHHLPSPRALVRLYGLLAGVWVVVASPIWVNQLATSLRGDWADAALSDVLSEKYGSPVRVRDVHFERWYALRFSALAIDSKEGRPLVRASGGTMRLRHLDLSKYGTSETELRFEDIFFTKDYYASSRAKGTWGFLLQKPIHINALCFLVRQNRSGMKVVVTDCRSEGIQIKGGVEVGRSGTFRDTLQVSVSPWTALRSMF